MLFTLCCTVAAASGSSLTQQQFHDLVEGLIPEIEERTGRSFVRVPRNGIATRERLTQALTRPYVEVRPPGAEPAPRVPTEHEKELIERAIAVYVPSLDGVYLIKEAVEETITEVGLQPDALHPLVRCIVALPLHLFFSTSSLSLLGSAPDISSTFLPFL